jgi:membrane protein
VALATSRGFSAERQFKSLWKLGGLTRRQLARNVFEELVANNVFGRAAELAFYFLFALFPLILLMGTLFGLFAAHRVELQNSLLSYFADFLPATAFQLLKTVATELAEHASGTKLTFGILTALWGVSGGVSSMISFLNCAHHARETRSWLKIRAITMGLSLLISILILAALLMVLLGNHFVDRVGTELGWQRIVIQAWKALQWPSAILFVSASCSLIYYWGPDLKEHRSWNWFTPGSACGALVWLLASFGFRAYLHFFNNYSYSYGSLGAVMILLMWLYVTGLAFLVGGETNAVIERAQKGLGASSAAA